MTSRAATSLRPYLNHEVIGPAAEDVPNFGVLTGSRYGFYPSAGSDGWEWQFDFRQGAPVASLLAHDCARFSCAAFQTFSSVPSAFKPRPGVPWALIKAYYSAFYAGHALLRMLGQLCSFVDHEAALNVRKVLSLYSQEPRFQRGLYLANLKPGGVLELKRLSSESGGVHEAFWGVFSAEIRRLEDDLLLDHKLPIEEAQVVSTALTDLHRILRHDKCAGNWLSRVRNALQYRQSKGGWHPNLTPKRQLASLERLAVHWKGDPLQVPLHFSHSQNDETGTFLAACTFMVALCRSLHELLGSTASRHQDRPFVARQPLRLLASLRLK